MRVLLLSLLFVVQVLCSPEALKQLYGTPDQNSGHVESSQINALEVDSDFLNDHEDSDEITGANIISESLITAAPSVDKKLGTRSFVNVENRQNIGTDGLSLGKEGLSSSVDSGHRESSGNSGFIQSSKVTPIELEESFNHPRQNQLTVTVETTRDVYKTFTNVFYNSIPVTLTQFIKSTRVEPAVKVELTPVDDRVLISTAPVTRTDVITVTDSKTAHQYVTQVETDIYTILHRAYDIRQQVLSSTLTQTEVVRPTVISTVILTEVETSTAYQTVLNTIVLEPPRLSTFTDGSGESLSNFLNQIYSNDTSAAAGILSLATIQAKYESLVAKQNTLIARAITFPLILGTLIRELAELEESKNMNAEQQEAFLNRFAAQQKGHAEEMRVLTFPESSLNFKETPSRRYGYGA